MCDFIKDESGLWWFIGCRAFRMNGTSGRPSLRFFTLETHSYNKNDNDDSDEEKKKKAADD